MAYHIFCGIARHVDARHLYMRDIQHANLSILQLEVPDTLRTGEESSGRWIQKLPVGGGLLAAWGRGGMNNSHVPQHRTAILKLSDRMKTFCRSDRARTYEQR